MKTSDEWVEEWHRLPMEVRNRIYDEAKTPCPSCGLSAVPQSWAVSTIKELKENPDLLIRLAIDTGALRFYSLCSKHQGPNYDDKCELCQSGSYGVAAHEGSWTKRVPSPE